MKAERSKLEKSTTADTRVVTAHVPTELADKVDLMAERLERSRAWIMKQALNDWIRQEEERDRLIQEALANVDSGNVVDHEVMVSWLNSLSAD